MRTAYFAVWPFARPDDACSPTVAEKGKHYLDALGTTPANFFLTAFSVLTYTL